MLSPEAPRWISAVLTLCLLPETINLLILHVTQLIQYDVWNDNWQNLVVAVNFMLFITCCLQITGAFILNKEFHKMTIVLFVLIGAATTICNLVLQSKAISEITEDLKWIDDTYPAYYKYDL